MFLMLIGVKNGVKNERPQHSLNKHNETESMY